ncbi:sigma-like protein [Streptomyces tremellae]
MSEAKKDEEITTLDSHAPAPPADGKAAAKDADAAADEVTTLDSHAGSEPADGPPIKPLDSHAP